MTITPEKWHLFIEDLKKRNFNNAPKCAQTNEHRTNIQNNGTEIK